jgi:Tfp pilus assembly protein PilX
MFCYPSVRSSTRRGRLSSGKRGFALLITITLLAFLVLLLVSLASLTRVETQVASNSQQIAQARQNALFALNLALGQLQKAAGPDQRVTATADILANTDPTKKKWTGVWDTRTANLNDPPVWLVSQASPAAADLPKNNTAAPTLAANVSSSTTAVRLVGAKSADISASIPANAGNEVVVPLQNIQADNIPGLAAGPATVGRFGYWVGDEGVKARINLTDPYAAQTDTLSLLNRIDSAQRNAWELFSGSTSPTPSSVDPASVITDTMITKADRMLSPQQIALLANSDSSAPANATTVLQTLVNSRFHDYTLWSAGVQADVKNGGLKWDLSTGFEQAAAVPLTNATNLFRLSEFGDNAPQMRDSSTNQLNSPVSSYSTSAGGAPAASLVSFVFTPPINAGGVSTFLRGPTWHLLRSHYLLYQERTPSTPSSTPLRGRALYPSGKTLGLGQNTPAALYEVYNALSNNADPGTNRMAAGQLVPRLTQAGIAPYIQRVFVRFGIKTTYRSDVDRYVVNLVMNPIVVLHNPYNVDISLTSLSGAQNQYGLTTGAPKIAGLINLFDSTGAGLPLTARIKVNGFDYMPSGREGGAGTKVLDLARNHLVNSSKTFNLLIPELTLKAGESRALYPQTIGINELDQPTIRNDPVRSSTDNTYVTLGVTPNAFGGFLISLLNGVRDNSPYVPVRPASAGDVNPGHPSARTNPVINETALQYTSYSGGATATEIWCKADDNVSVVFNTIGGSFDLKYSLESLAGDTAYQSNTDNSSLTYQLNASFPPYTSGTPTGINAYVKDYTGYTKDNSLLGLPANACTTTKYCFAVDLFVKSADHDADKAGRPFVISNPVAFEQQDSAMGDQALGGSNNGTRGFPGIMPAYQLNFATLDPNQGLANFMSTVNGRAYWGPSRESAGGLLNNTLINIPSRPLTSLADFQHANIAIFGYQPYFAVGNSYASPYVPANLDPPANLVGFAGATAKPYFLYDLSYLMNEALWDKYFFSSLSQELSPSSGTWNNTDATLSASIQTWAAGQRTLPNARMVPYNGNRITAAANLSTLKTAYRQAAASLLTLGSFNINSRSIDAWAAVLGAARGISVVADGGGSPGPTPVTNATAIPRMTPTGQQSDNSPISSATWNGFTALSDAQIRQLAKTIVDEITRRQGNKVVPGPFRSLGEFINRSLQNDLNSGVSSNGAKGPLQAALDEPSNSLSPNYRFFNDPSFRDIKTAQGDSKWKYQWATSTNSGADYLAGQGPTTSTAQGFLLQADVLQQIGPFLSARSDTFVIRTFGESINPATGASAGKAWCEAVVQRLPDYVDQTDTKLSTAPSDGLKTALYDATPPYKTDAYGTITNNIGTNNQTFGRRFKIVSFRWLTAQDI